MPGQDSGHPFPWGDYVDWLVQEHGSLSGVADTLAHHNPHSVSSIERAIRRLRYRRGDGGVWGPRLVQRFGLPGSVASKLRWMGQYHSGFSDLPEPIARDLLGAWNRPPITESPNAIWLHLCAASLALRRDDVATAQILTQRHRPTTRSVPSAHAEHHLVRAFLVSRSSPSEVAGALELAERAMHDVQDTRDRTCLLARLIDQRAYELNVRLRRHREAYELYLAIPDDAPPFALVRRHNGLGWCAHKLGDRDEAAEHVAAALRHAGDGGSLRLRVMALRLAAVVTQDPADAERYRQRAVQIAVRLEDVNLVRRLHPQ